MGGLITTWVDYRSADPEPYAQRVNSSGVVQFAADGKVVLADLGVQRGALVIPDGSGGTWIAWSEKSGGDYEVRARRVDTNGAAVTGSITVCGASGDQWVAGAVADGAGGVVIGWVDERAGDDDADVYAQRLNGAGVAQWAADGVVVCNAAGRQGELRMTTDGAGSAIFAWSDFRVGAPDIYAQRLNGSGVAQWSANGVGVCTEVQSQASPVIVSSGAGGSVIAWIDERFFLAPFVGAQRLNGAGAAQWTANGLQISVLSGFFNRCAGAVSDGGDGAIVLTDTDAFRERAMLVSDGAGGAIAAWSDARSPHDIYAQRVDDIGLVQWAAGGAVVCNAASWQWLSGIAPDGAGGAVLAWSDERNGFSDVYAQRVNSAGAPQWTANGAAVADVARGQYEAAMHAAGGTPVLVWTDFRNGSERLLYADKLSALGASQWAADGVTSTLFSMVAAEATLGRVRVTWAVGVGPFEVTAYRRGESEAWQLLGVLPVDGTGRVELEDESVEPGARYAYRIGVREDGAERFSGEVWIDVPAELSLTIDGVRPQPARGDVWISFSLAGDSPARIEVLNVSGRRVGGRELTGLGAGRHVVRMPEVPPTAGVYFVVLTQGGESVRGRVVRVR